MIGIESDEIKEIDINMHGKDQQVVRDHMPGHLTIDF